MWVPQLHDRHQRGPIKKDNCILRLSKYQPKKYAYYKIKIDDHHYISTKLTFIEENWKTNRLLVDFFPTIFPINNLILFFFFQI